MLLGGDELGRTQQGNNNAYCQDNELSWFDWQNADRDLLAFVTRLIRLRSEHPVLRRRNWFAGHPLTHAHADVLPDIAWFAPDGTEMTEESWSESHALSLVAFLNGSAISTRDRRGEPIVDDSFLLLFNAHDADVEFAVLDADWGSAWIVEIDTAQPTRHEKDERLAAGSTLGVTGRSVVVLRRVADEEHVER
jgi:glycogen operon protein